MWLTIRTGKQRGRVVAVTGDRFVIGRTEDCDLIIDDDEKISRQHCALVPMPDGKAFLEDLGSMNGTWVNGNRITAPVLLEGNEQVQVGDLRMVTARAEPRASATQSRPAIPDASELEEAAAASAGSDATTARAIPPASPSGERRALRRDVKTATALAVAATLVAAAVGTGVVVDRLLEDTRPTPSPPASEQELTISDIVERATPSTVLVVSKLRGQRVASGTGWVLDAAQGFIVTNFHVVNGADAIDIGVADQMREARLVGGAPCEDLAVVQVTDPSGLVTLPLGSQSELRQGDQVVALGYPISATLDDILIATEGIVSAVNTTFDIRAIDVPQFPNVVQTDAAINPGNSGGPLVDLQGRLVGVNTARQSEAGGQPISGQGFAIGVDRVREVTPTLTAGRSFGWTGSSILLPGVDVDPRSIGLPAEPGFVIDTVLPGSPAEQAGFGKEPALVTAIDGQPIGRGGIPAYCRIMNGRGQGDTAVFTATFRGGGPRDVQVGFL